MEVDIHLNATDVETKEKRVARIPTILYEADIDEDIILSYRWMGEREIVVAPRLHGMWLTVSKAKLWVAGVRTNPRQRSNARLPREPVYVNRIPGQTEDLQKPKALDLFCGRKRGMR